MINPPIKSVVLFGFYIFLVVDENLGALFVFFFSVGILVFFVLFIYSSVFSERKVHVKSVEVNRGRGFEVVG